MWLRSYDFFDVLNPLTLREVFISWNIKKVCKREFQLIRWVTCVYHTSRCQEPLPYCGRKSSSAVLCGTNFVYLHFPLSQIFKKNDESHPNRFSVDSTSIFWFSTISGQQFTTFCNCFGLITIYDLPHSASTAKSSSEFDVCVSVHHI